MSTTSPPALWAHVQALGAIAQCGSYTQAAQRLGLSKAAVSQRIAEPERAVGVPLLARTTRSVRLTEAGRQLVEDTAAAFAQVEQGLAPARALASKPQGLVRVTAPVALGRQHVAPQLEGFLRAWPGIRVELDLSDRLANLPHEGYDLAVRHTSAPPDNHVAVRLCASRTLLVAAPGYLKRRGEPATPAELAGHDCLWGRCGQRRPWRSSTSPPVAASAASAPSSVRRSSPSSRRSNASDRHARETLRDRRLLGGRKELPD